MMNENLLTGNRPSILDFCKLFKVDNPDSVRSFKFSVSVDYVAVLEIERFIYFEDEYYVEQFDLIKEKYSISLNKIIEEIK